MVVVTIMWVWLLVGRHMNTSCWKTSPCDGVSLLRVRKEGAASWGGCVVHTRCGEHFDPMVLGRVYGEALRLTISYRAR